MNLKKLKCNYICFVFIYIFQNKNDLSIMQRLLLFILNLSIYLSLSICLSVCLSLLSFFFLRGRELCERPHGRKSLAPSGKLLTLSQEPLTQISMRMRERQRGGSYLISMCFLACLVIAERRFCVTMLNSMITDPTYCRDQNVSLCMWSR